jgi:oligopeptide/dipeptide ABC transporter ATP-binding protein
MIASGFQFNAVTRVRKYISETTSGIMEPTRNNNQEHGQSDGEPAETLLQVRGLTIHHSTETGERFPAVENVSFSLAPGETLGLLGESGCGKSTTALALLGLLPSTSTIAEGSIHWRNKELIKLSEHEWEALRGGEIALITQDPGLALNPVLRAGHQVAEVLRAHRPKAENIRDDVLASLQQAGLADSARIYENFPHQLSGGEQQRVAIAQALAGSPKLLVADEPAASLDSTLQREIVSLLQDLNQKTQMALLLISHNPALIANLADRVLVMYAGEIVEEGTTEDVFGQPRHPYTKALLASLPHGDPGNNGSKKLLPVIEGSPPDPLAWPPACRFEPRCPERVERCAKVKPTESRLETGRQVRCLLYED